MAQENASPVPVDQQQEGPTSALGRDAQQQANREEAKGGNEESKEESTTEPEPLILPEKLVVGAQQKIEEDDDQVGELSKSTNDNGRGKKRLQARSGSITESTIEVGGFKKTVLETTSSSEDGSGSQDGHVSNGTSRQGSGQHSTGNDGAADSANDVDTQDHAKSTSNGDKKKRKKRGKKKKGTSSPAGD